MTEKAETNHRDSVADVDPTVTVALETLSSSETIEPSEIICSLCGSIIPDYTPVYFLEEEINPACNNCEDDDFEDETKDSLVEEYQLTKRGFNFRPKYPAQRAASTKTCAHSSCCKIRDPYPPPLPALIPLINMSSNYHCRFLKGELDWGYTCGYCFRIDHKNYGCPSCVWLKWYGGLHGYPDINPRNYKVYLDMHGIQASI